MKKNNLYIPLDKFIGNALYDKKRGFYMTRNPIGKNGHFITSPNISKMFSEMIAIWIISFWKEINEHNKINIIELGAGNGEMMKQIIRTINNFEDLNKKADYFIFEKSPLLKKIQRSKINSRDLKWINKLNNLSKNPTIFICNEFFDSFPIKQFIKKKSTWFEKYVIYEKKNFCFTEKKISKEYIEKLLEKKIDNKQNFIEFSPSAFKLLKEITKIIKSQNGGLLMIDYGFENKKMQNTLQSIKDHKKNNVLKNVYDSDITHLINFNMYEEKIKNYKIDFVKQTTQREFLIKMGILKRAEILAKNVPFSKKTDIYLRIKRLIDVNQMGTLFKVLFASNKKNNFKLGF